MQVFIIMQIICSVIPLWLSWNYRMKEWEDIYKQCSSRHCPLCFGYGHLTTEALKVISRVRPVQSRHREEQHHQSGKGLSSSAGDVNFHLILFLIVWLYSITMNRFQEIQHMFVDFVDCSTWAVRQFHTMDPIGQLDFRVFGIFWCLDGIQLFKPTWLLVFLNNCWVGWYPKRCFAICLGTTGARKLFRPLKIQSLCFSFIVRVGRPWGLSLATKGSSFLMVLLRALFPEQGSQRFTIWSTKERCCLCFRIWLSLKFCFCWHTSSQISINMFVVISITSDPTADHLM